MPGKVPDSSVRTSAVASRAVTNVQVGLNQSGRKPNSIASAMKVRLSATKGFARSQ